MSASHNRELNATVVRDIPSYLKRLRNANPLRQTGFVWKLLISHKDFRSISFKLQSGRFV